MAVQWPKCRAILLTKGPWGAELVVVHGWSYSQSDCYLDIGATLSVQATTLQKWHSLFISPDHLVAWHNCTAGRCCLYRAMLRTELPRSLLTENFGAGWVSNTIATVPRWPSDAPHPGASGPATSLYSTPWPPTCSGALPTWCTEVAPLLALPWMLQSRMPPGA